MNASPKGAPGLLLSFGSVTLIWGSTWLVIRDQLGTVPPSWSVAYRFAIAAAAMFAYAWLKGASLRLSARDQLFAVMLGVTQFVLNFNFVYRAEQHMASGLVALIFALLVLPNALLAWLFLRQPVSRGFLAGSAIALAGLTLLFAHELRAASAGHAAMGLGIGLTVAGVLSASIANVMQSTRRARALSMVVLLAWGMLWGALIDAAIAWAVAGPPAFDARPSYLAGLLYLGIVASAVAFTLYFNVIRAIGPGPAAYSSVVVPVIAMLLTTIFEDYRWSVQAAAGVALALAGLAVALRARSPAR